MEGRQGRFFVDAHDLLQRAAQAFLAVGKVHGVGDAGLAEHGEYGIRAGDQPVPPLGLALGKLHRLRPQHEMGEVEVEFMGRQVGAFGLRAEIAEIALVHDLAVVLLRHAVHFHGLGLIHEIEEHGEGLAEADATAAGVADVKNPLKLLVQGLFVPEFWGLPVVRFALCFFEIAFTIRCHGRASCAVRNGGRTAKRYAN